MINNKKAEGKLKGFVIGALVFTLFLVGGMVLISDTSKTYPEMIDNTELQYFGNTFNKTAELSSQVDDIRSNVEGLAAEEEGLLSKVQSILDLFILSAWGTFSSFLTSFSFILDIFSSLSAYPLGIPVWVVGLIVSIITIYIGFAIYGLLFGKEP